MSRRWLRRSGWTLAALVLLLALAVLWLGTTSGGLRFVLGRATVALGDRLAFDRAEGTLFGGLTLHGVRYQDPAVGRWQVARITVAPRSRRLLGGELVLTGLALDGVEGDLPPPADPPPDDEPFRLPALPAPVAMTVERLAVDGVVVRDHLGGEVIAVQRIDGAASWRGHDLAIDALRVVHANGQLELQARFDTADDWRGRARVDVDGHVPGREDLPLVLQAELDGPQQQPALALSVTAPAALQVTLARDAVDAERWQLQAKTDDLALATLWPQAPVQRVSLDLSGAGAGLAGEIAGSVMLDGYALQLDTLAGRWSDPQLVVEALRIAEADGPGRVEGSAQVSFADAVPTGTVDLRWQQLSPPWAAPFDALALQGRVQATGSARDLSALIAAEGQVDGQAVQLQAQVAGDPQGRLDLAPLRLRTGDGQLEADGWLDLASTPTAQAQVLARDFNPGLLLPDWPGQVDVDAQVAATLPPDGATVDLQVTQLGGTLRGQPLRGAGRVALAQGQWQADDLDLRLGDNRVQADGRWAGADSRARLRLDLSDLDALHDDLGGRLEGDLVVSGQWPSLALDGTLAGADLAWQDQSIATLAYQGRLSSDLGEAGEFNLQVTDARVAGQALQRLEAGFAGDADAHTLTVEVDADAGQLVLAADGRYDAGARRWQGRPRTLQLRSPAIAESLSLAEAGDWSWADGGAELQRTCLANADTARLCVDGRWRPDDGLDAGLELTRLPLAWLLVADPDQALAADGELSGRGRVRWPADGAFAANLQVQGTPGRLRRGASDRDLLAWSALDLRFDLDAGGGQLDAELAVLPRGHVRAQVSAPADASAPLDGQVDVDLPDLAWLGLLTPQVVDPSGHLQGRITVAGSRGQPLLGGELVLDGFGAELPAAGLRLRDSRLAVRGSANDRLAVDGRFDTGGDGALTVDGWIGLRADGFVAMDLAIGGERVLVADLPAARVIASPALTLASDARRQRLRLRGRVDIPQARLEPERFEGGTVAVSPDVVVIDPEATSAAQAEADAEAALALPLYADVVVALGDRVRIEGYGLDGRLRGELALRERPRRPLSARGEIVVTGDYQAYGQDLEIERGRLLFTGGGIENPLLDIRATRRVQNVTAGLAVTGTAQRPVLEVYSVPAMDQAAALSYLVLGRPLRQATSASDQDLLGTAAAAITTAGGDLLAKSLGSRLGLDEVGVGSSRELGAAALTLGKYLSPRLYLGYGRSLFDGGQVVLLRYRLSERLEAEIQSGTQRNKAGLNYRYER